MEEKERTFEERVGELVCSFDVSKDQFNGFGKYSYFNAGSVMAKIKTFIKERNLGLYLTATSDTVEGPMGQPYIEVIVTIHDMWSDKKISSASKCKEPAEKKGMDASQISGSSTSYAWKYALMLLLGLSGVKDSDSYDNSESVAAPSSPQPQTNGVPGYGYQAQSQPQFNGQNNVPINPEVGQGRFPI